MAEAWSEAQAQQGMVVSQGVQRSQFEGVSEWLLSLLRIAKIGDSFVSISECCQKRQG